MFANGKGTTKNHRRHFYMKEYYLPADLWKFYWKLLSSFSPMFVSAYTNTFKVDRIYCLAKAKE